MAGMTIKWALSAIGQLPAVTAPQQLAEPGVDERVNLPYDEDSLEALITLANTYCSICSSRVVHADT